MTRRHERTAARRRAVQLLYTCEIHRTRPSRLLKDQRSYSDEGPVPEYAVRLVEGVEEHRPQIDSWLADTSENWSLSRMPIVDRSILRLATYEMLFVEEVPVSVTINEAVELAKDFGGEDDSPRFVNGVLGRIAKRLENEAAVEVTG